MADTRRQSIGFTREELDRRMLHRRAVEAVIWGMPAVNYDAMYQAVVRDAGGGFNQVVYWSRLLDWRNQTLTPNPDAIYLMPFIDTSDEPIVLEIPAAEGGIDHGQCRRRLADGRRGRRPGRVDRERAAST